MVSKSSAKLLLEFLQDPSREQYGFGLMGSTGVKSGSLYPILDRLERVGWIESHDEDVDEQVEGRPKRRLYRLTAVGEPEARRAVADFYRDLAPAPAWARLLEGA